MARLPKYGNFDGLKKLNHTQTRHKTAKKMALHLLQMGKEPNEVVEYLVNDWGYAEGTARSYLSEVNREVRDAYDAYIKDVARNNISKLLAISDEQYDAGSLKELVRTIDILNKMTGQYTIKIEGGDENKPINITFK